MRSPAQTIENETHFRIVGPQPDRLLFLSHLSPTPPTASDRVVLYIHGATFPSALSIAYRFDGISWRDILCEAGFHVWGFDFYGFGHSDRYAEMGMPAEGQSPVLRTADAAQQIDYALRFICGHHGVKKISLIAHSWGTIAAGRFASEHPDMIDRLVMFGPITERSGASGIPPSLPAWRIVTPADQWARFVEDVPQGAEPVLSRRHFDDWAVSYLDSDRDARDRTPAGVQTPNGPLADILQAWHGQLSYDPRLIKNPVAIIRGEWDSLTTDKDAGWLFDALSAASHKRDIKIGRATHLMHLESSRFALYRESLGFLTSNDEPPRGAAQA